MRNGIFPSKGRFNLPAALRQAYSAHRPRQQNFLSEIKSSTATWVVIVCCIVVAGVSIFALMHDALVIPQGPERIGCPSLQCVRSRLAQSGHSETARCLSAFEGKADMSQGIAD